MGHVLSIRRRRRHASCDTSLVVSGGVCWWRERDSKMFMTRSFSVTPKTTKQHLIARSDKSVAYVTNNKRLYSTFCTVVANYWQTQSIARPLCDNRATCLLIYAFYVHGNCASFCDCRFTVAVTRCVDLRK